LGIGEIINTDSGIRDRIRNAKEESFLSLIKLGGIEYLLPRSSIHLIAWPKIIFAISKILP
jgi:hypothetical protein